jgi:hypothetical protein
MQTALRPTAEKLREWFMPAQSMRYADTPELRAAYDQALLRAHAKGGGKVPPVPGSPMFSPGQGIALDLAANWDRKFLVSPKGCACCH